MAHELVSGVTEPSRAPRVLALPDVFLDHFVYLGKDELESLVNLLKGKEGRSRLRQELGLGGNACNFALHLSKLGVNTVLVAKVSELVFGELVRRAQGLPLDLSYIEKSGDQPLTVAFELAGGSNSSSINLNHPGNLLDFGPEDIPRGALNGHYDAIGVFNWGNNRRSLELCRRVFKHRRTIKLVDLATPALRRDDVHEIREVCRVADILSANEVETIFIAHALDLTSKPEVEHCAKAIAGLGVTVALRAKNYTAEVDWNGWVEVSFKRRRVRKSTGAGDAWNAAYICAKLRGASAKESLAFANDYAASSLS